MDWRGNHMGMGYEEILSVQLWEAVISLAGMEPRYNQRM